LGRQEEALTTIDDAVSLYQQLAEARPEMFLPNLAMSLNNQSHWLADLGWQEEALTTLEDAVSLYRQLAEARPEVFLPNLAASLRNQGSNLVSLGRLEEAAMTLENAVSIYRRLDQVRPKLFGPELSRSLDLLAGVLSALGTSEKVEDARTEAKSIRQASSVDSSPWPEQKVLLHDGLLIVAAYLRDDNAELAGLLVPFMTDERVSRLVKAFTYVAVFATDMIAAGQGRPFQEVLQSIDEHTEVFLVPGLPVGPWAGVLRLASVVKRDEDEARRMPPTMDIPSAINVMFRLAVSALTDLTNVPQFAHMTSLALAEMLITVVEQEQANG
jgi:hypothetical protein